VLLLRGIWWTLSFVVPSWLMAVLFVIFFLTYPYYNFAFLIHIYSPASN
jgi:hypothetical protein